MESIKKFLYLLAIVQIIAVRAVFASDVCETQTEMWKYTTVRPDAHMFWWLYCTSNQAGYHNVPLVLWLQGGPGGSSTGFGNFGEIGPLNVDQKPRETTWLKEVNLLFVDNPVGTGYSYVGPKGSYTSNVEEIAQDLLTTFKDVLMHAPAFQKVPFYIFSESYGGKMTAAFSKVLLQEIDAGRVTCDFRGFAMGDSWISPMDSVLTWGPYLYATSLVDGSGLSKINASAEDTQRAVDAGQWKDATDKWQQTEDIISEVTGGVNFYNILKWGEDDEVQGKISKLSSNSNWNTTIGKLYQRHVGVLYGDALADLMNGVIRKKLQIIPENVTWGGQSGEVFSHQSGDFMKDVISTVDDLLLTRLQVVVYSGQLDLIVDTVGTERWLRRLSWPGLPDFLSADRNVIKSSSSSPVVQAFVKQFKNFSFYWILDAGHMVPSDNGVAALEMLRRVTKQKS